MKSTQSFTRIAASVLRSLRYVLGLLVWSRVYIARRTTANIRINEAQLNRKAIRFRQPSMLIEGNPELDYLCHGFDVVYDILFANLNMPNHLTNRRHALPGPAFAGIYLWDSAFIALIWQYWDQDVAMDVLEAVVQVRDGDRLQHVVADFVRSNYTQPPLIAWAVIRIINSPKINPSRLANLYEALNDYHQWLRQHRRLGNGLYFWAHPYESGVENAPRFSSADEKRLDDTRHYAAPDLSAYVVLQCEALATMAELLQKPEAELQHLADAQALRQKMNHYLWDEQAGMYFDLDVNNNEFIRTRTIASLLPLAAGVPSSSQANKMLSHILDPRSFATLLPLPAVARNDIFFEKDMWRGPVWINTAYLVLDGLKRYHFNHAYGELSWRLCSGVYRVLANEHQVYEFYDPDNTHTSELMRKKGNWWKALTLGSGPQKDFVGWSGLVNTLMLEAILGVEINGNQLTLSPRLPMQTQGSKITAKLPQFNLMLSFHHGGDDLIHIRVVKDNYYHCVEVINGKSININLNNLAQCNETVD